MNIMQKWWKQQRDPGVLKMFAPDGKHTGKITKWHNDYQLKITTVSGLNDSITLHRDTQEACMIVADELLKVLERFP